MARELPDLIEALHPALGDVLGIDDIGTGRSTRRRRI
jgi:hypothetical protein